MLNEHDKYKPVVKLFIEISEEFVKAKNLKGARLVNELYEKMLKDNNLDSTSGLFFDVGEFLYD
ncbi:MAG: hypothetical protein LBQ02_04535 [Candidatus Nomurabacteria bacterium]|jgi:predicted DNA-binding ribbon-helix-helix protein|nr:hypothetical protein [Candidatus Nomurabacteria bacterium]